MDSAPTPFNPFDTGSAPSTNRKHGRLRCQDVECSAGEILDISRGGMRVRCRRIRPPEGAPYGVTISACGTDIVVTCVTKWVRKTGFQRYEAGLEFVDLNDENRRLLAALARACAHNETIHMRRESA